MYVCMYIRVSGMVLKYANSSSPMSMMYNTLYTSYMVQSGDCVDHSTRGGLVHWTSDCRVPTVRDVRTPSSALPQLV